MKAAITLMHEFATANSGKAFAQFIEYIDRDEVKPEDHDVNFDGYIEYMDDPEKTTSTGLFSGEALYLTKEDKKNYSRIYREAQEAGSNLWKTVFSFDSEFLDENGLLKDGVLNEEIMKEYIAEAVAVMQKEEGLDTCVWLGEVHHNTDHYHVHVSMVDPNPIWIEGKGRCKKDAAGNLFQKGKFKQKSLEKAKSSLAGSIIHDKKDLKLLSELTRDMGHSVELEMFKTDPQINALMITLIEDLPSDKSHWKYNMNTMGPYRDRIDALAEKIIDKYMPEEHKEMLRLLDKKENDYRNIYGEGSDKYKDFKANKEKDFKAMMGNKVLKAAKGYSHEAAKSEYKNKRPQGTLNQKKSLKSKSEPSINGDYKHKSLVTNFSKTKAGARQLGISVDRLQRLMRKDIQTIKNQLRYDELQREAENLGLE